MTLQADSAGSLGLRRESLPEEKIIGPFFGRVYLALRHAEDSTYFCDSGREGQAFLQDLHMVTALAEQVARRELKIGSHRWFRSPQVASWVFAPLSRFVRSIEAQPQRSGGQSCLDDPASSCTVAASAATYFTAAAPLRADIFSSRPANSLVAQHKLGLPSEFMSDTSTEPQNTKDARFASGIATYWLRELHAGLKLALLCEKYGFWLIARHPDLRVRLADESSFREQTLLTKNTFFDVEACAELLEFESSLAIPAHHSCPPRMISGHSSSQEPIAVEGKAALRLTSSTAAATTRGNTSPVAIAAKAFMAAVVAVQTGTSTDMTRNPTTRPVPPQPRRLSSYHNSNISCSQEVVGIPDQTPATASGTANLERSASKSSRNGVDNHQSFPALDESDSRNDPNSPQWCLLSCQSSETSPSGTVTPTPSEQEIILACSFHREITPFSALPDPASGHDDVATVADADAKADAIPAPELPSSSAAPDECSTRLKELKLESRSGHAKGHARIYRPGLVVTRSDHTIPYSGSCDHRWWMNLTDRCPISNTLVSILPYPPFKLLLKQHGHSPSPSSTSRESPEEGSGHHVLIDGQFFAVQVLAHWDFTTPLGEKQPLTEGFITALDKYLKRCKASAFRLAPALELAKEGTFQAQQELALLRAKAAQRLQRLLLAKERRSHMPASAF